MMSPMLTASIKTRFAQPLTLCRAVRRVPASPEGWGCWMEDTFRRTTVQCNESYGV